MGAPEPIHAHDWRIVSPLTLPNGAAVVVQCADCAERGIVVSPTPLERQKACVAKRDQSHAPQYTAALERIHRAGSPTFDAIDWTATEPVWKAHLTLEDYIVRGRWYLACREWIRRHAPCTVDDYHRGVAEFLPERSVLNCSNASAGAVARDALRRLPVLRDGDIIHGLKHNKPGRKVRQ